MTFIVLHSLFNSHQQNFGEASQTNITLDADIKLTNNGCICAPPPHKQTQIFCLIILRCQHYFILIIQLWHYWVFCVWTYLLITYQRQQDVVNCPSALCSDDVGIPHNSHCRSWSQTQIRTRHRPGNSVPSFPSSPSPFRCLLLVFAGRMNRHPDLACPRLEWLPIQCADDVHN